MNSTKVPEELRILCPYCNANFTASMVADLRSSAGCDTCDYGSEPAGTIDILCHECGRLVYRKEI
jgi:hypothetical protein